MDYLLQFKFARSFSGTEYRLISTICVIDHYFAKVKTDLENLEEKVDKANTIHKNLHKLSTSEDFMSNNAIDESIQTIARRKVELENMEQELLKAMKIKTEVESITQDPNFMTKDAISKYSEMIETSKASLRKTIGNTLSKKSFNEIVLAQEEACGELQCVVCFEVPPAEVFTCKENHILCHACKPRVLHQCPFCRQSFTQSPPKRNRLAEKMILKLL